LPAEVSEVVPASAGSVVMATSHRRQEQLHMDGAFVLPVEPLDPLAGTELLKRMIGEARAAAEPDAVAALVAAWGGLAPSPRAGGGLPLALRAVGAGLADRRRWPLARLVEEVSDEGRRLGGFLVEGRPIVEAVWEVVYRDMPEPVARMYGLLALHPGPEISLPA